LFDSHIKAKYPLILMDTYFVAFRSWKLQISAETRKDLVSMSGVHFQAQTPWFMLTRNIT